MCMMRMTITTDITTDMQRSTKQRSAIAAILDATEDFRSAQEIYADLRAAGEGVGLTTVYRTLQAMTISGELDCISREDGEMVYRRCSTTHHHHLVCRTCGRTEEIQGPSVERWASQVASEHGFTDVSHTLEIFGTCPRCADISS